MNRQLIINADDYGLCREVNRAVENLIAAGRLRSVSVLANGLYCDEAVDFLAARADCSAGVHLNVVEGVPLQKSADVAALLDARRQFAGLREIILRFCRAPFAVARAIESEWRAQIECLLRAGLKITHADSHQHIHAFPPFWRIAVRLCREYGIPALRLPRERNRISRRQLPALALRQAANFSELLAAPGKLFVNQHFLGFKRAGDYGEEALLSDLRDLKPGVTELCLHPSLCDGVPYPELRGAIEYDALLGERLLRQLNDSQIRLTNWTEAAHGSPQPLAQTVN